MYPDTSDALNGSRARNRNPYPSWPEPLPLFNYYTLRLRLYTGASLGLDHAFVHIALRMDSLRDMFPVSFRHKRGKTRVSGNIGHSLIHHPSVKYTCCCRKPNEKSGTYTHLRTHTHRRTHAEREREKYLPSLRSQSENTWQVFFGLSF